MNRLHRELAPISAQAWAALDAEATTYLQNLLAARRLMEFHGPTGATALPTGRVESVGDKAVNVARVSTIPFFELRRSFTLVRSELDALERGAADIDLDPLRDAAKSVAAAEDRLAFDGIDGSTAGVAGASPHDALEISSDFAEYPTIVAEAVATLREDGVGGPYGLALGPGCYRGVIETTERGGYVVFDHLRKITGGPLVWAPTVDGALVVSMQGGDYHLEASEDLALGYASHDADGVELFITETIAFRVDGDDAAVVLRHKS